MKPVHDVELFDTHHDMLCSVPKFTFPPPPQVPPPTYSENTRTTLHYHQFRVALQAKEVKECPKTTFKFAGVI